MRVSVLVAAAAVAVGSWGAGDGPARAAYRLDTVNLVACAQEGGVCRMPHPTNVYFGVPGKTNGRPFPKGGSIPCNVQSFGDPAPGQPKSCWYAARIGDGDRDANGPARMRGDDDRDDDRPRYGDRSRFDDRPRYDGRDRRDVDGAYDRPRRSYEDDAPPRRRDRVVPDDE